MYIESIKYFDENLINAWKNEMKPFILQKFPLIKSELFTLNSDFNFFIQIIDSLAEEFGNKKIESKNEKNESINNSDDKKINESKEEKDIKNNEDIKEVKENLENNKNKDENENQQKLKKSNKKRNRRGTLVFDEIPAINKVSTLKVYDNKNMKDKEEEDIKILRKKNIPKIYLFLLEFIKENIDEPKRTNSMINLRPHSQTVKSDTTCDTSIVEDNNKISSKNVKDIEEISSNININEELNNKKNNNINLYENMFKESKEKKDGENSNKKKPLNGQTIPQLREMNLMFKEEAPEEGKNIIFKEPEKTLTYIYPDILLQKIIKEDFINNNLLLIHHFCQQCFCFINKEIFFIKIFNCYKYYKNNTSKKKLKNLIEFINILVIEMFEYYQKIDLNDTEIIKIKKYYNELIRDLITSLDIEITENENNINEENDDNYKQFRFDSIDYLSNKDDNNSNSNNNFIINKKTLVNMNLNIEIKDINIFVFQEKEQEEKKKYETPKALSKSVYMPKTSLSPNLNKSSVFTKTISKDFQEDIEQEREDNTNTKNKNHKKTVSFIEGNTNKDVPKDEKEKEIDFNLNINEISKELNKQKDEKKEKEKEEDLNLNIGEISKEINKQKEEKKEKEKEEKEKKHKSVQISKTLRKSQVVTMDQLKFLKDNNIIEEEDIQKEKSDEEKKIDKLLYSDRSDKDSDNKNNLSSESEKEEENKKHKTMVYAKSSKNISYKKKRSKDLEEKEKKKEEEEKQKIEAINNILKDTKMPENLISLNENILLKFQSILFLFDKKVNGEPTYHEIKEAKESISFYKNLKNIKNQGKKKYIEPIQAQKRLTKSYSFFNIGTMSSKPKISAREYLRKGYFCVLDWPIEEIGDQLSKISKYLLNKIYPRELYRAIYLKKNKEITSPNVVECINKFNRLTSFIIEDILSYDLPKDRAKIYERWVLIAEYCKLNKDYNDVIAIFSALNHYVITGLNLTLKEVKYKINTIFKKISEFCTCEGNYRNIREDMNNCEKTGEIFVPYLGMLLRDINFFEESSKYINQYGNINFEKIENISKILEKYFIFRNKPEKTTKVKELMFFEDLEDITEERLEEMANKLEPEFEGQPIPGKHLTSIDKKYFEKYTKRPSIMNLNVN